MKLENLVQDLEIQKVDKVQALISSLLKTSLLLSTAAFGGAVVAINYDHPRGYQYLVTSLAVSGASYSLEVFVKNILSRVQ